MLETFLTSDGPWRTARPVSLRAVLGFESSFVHPTKTMLHGHAIPKEIFTFIIRSKTLFELLFQYSLFSWLVLSKITEVHVG